MRRFAALVVVAITVLFSTAVLAQKVKEPLSSLDNLTLIRPELRVSETPADSELIRSLLPNAKDIDLFRAENGVEWKFIMDERRGVPTLVDGGAIPFIPGPANGLSWDSFAPSGCRNYSCIPSDLMEKLARDFMMRYEGALRVNPGELELDPLGSVPVDNSIYFLRFQWKYAGIPVEGASVFFRINNGNLIQVATDKIGPINLDPIPALSLESAWQVLEGYLGEYGSEKDTVLDKGTLIIIPVTPMGMDPDFFGSGSYGNMISYKLVYRLSFQRPNVIGTWEALIDAHTGEIVRFVDSNRYGHVHGGIRPSDGLPPEEDRPFPLADIGGGLYTDSAGNFTGNNATVTLTGKYCHISDACGPISATTTTGEIDFGSGATGTDCTVPDGNTYGAGNTKPSRTLFYNVSNINVRAQVWNPGNTWLPNNYVTCNVNGAAWCNATSGGGVINFYKAASGCNNLGEIPAVAMHEWGHSYDTNDGSGGQDPPLETYADWTAIMSTHNSCTGAGFLTSGTCGGYGNPCSTCSGVRDCDYMQHSPATPWTSALNGSVYSCSAGSYNGPCGWEDHCESGISTQALWDFVNRDLEAAPTNMDITSAWMLEDRLWFTGVITLNQMYTCSGGVTSGCTGNVLYTVMRAIDDDGDGTGNGTPHAAAIFAALNRHGIACGAASDATNQNHVNASCPTQTITTLSGVAGSNQVYLSWPAVTNATRYWIFRNEGTCSSGYTRIATVNAPTTTYTDNGVANGTAYNYRFQSATASDSCTSAVSNCVTVTPMPCAGSIALDKTLYNCADTVNVTVLDSTPGASPWTVEAWSTTDATHKTITLTNNPPGSANYTGSFTTTTGSAGATQVQVANGATITIRYVDKDYCGTPNQNVDATVSVDCVGPVITNVLATNITDSGATITWTTNESANSRVTYGTSSPPGTNKDDLITYVTSHSVTLTGLTGCETYGFSVTSVDAAGNSTTDTNGGAYYTFTTLGRYFSFGPDNVEGGINGWTASGTAGSIWHIDTCRANSGTHAWKAGASDAPTCTAQYGNSVTTDLTSSVIALGSAGHGLHLRWNEWYVTESGYDYCQPQISTDGGTTWTTLGTQYAGNSGGWIAKDMDLAGYAGSNVKVRFHFTSDGGVTAEGWYVDDIEVSKPAGCFPMLQWQSNTFTDACSGTGTGVGNGYVDTGEDITVPVTMVNTGMLAGTGISATLSTATAGITVTTASATFPNIAANGGTGASNSPHFIYRVDPSVACGTTINFTLHAISAENPTGTDSTFSMVVGHVVPGGATPLSENWDSVTPPAFPSGWATVNVSGTGVWATNAGTRYPSGQPSHSTPNLAYFNSFTCSSGTQTRLYRTSGVAIPADATSATLTFWMYHDTGYTGNNDRVQAQVSTNGGSSWTDVGTAVSRYDGSTGWKVANVDLTTYKGQADVRIAFLGISAYGNDCHIDDVSVSYVSTGSCTVQACTPSAPGVNIIYQSHGAFTPVDTNGNGTMEAGEKYSVQVTLQNTGSVAANDVAANLSGMAAGDGITVCNNPGTYGTIAAGGTASYTYTFVVDPAKWYTTYACGTNLTFNVVGKSTSTSGCTCADEMAVFSNQVGIAGGNETATQVTTPLNATSNTMNSNLASAFTLGSATTATLSYTSNYTQAGGTTTLFGPDDFANLNNWTAVRAATNTGYAHCSHTNILGRMTGVTNNLNGSITQTTAISTVGYSNIQVFFDYKLNNTNSVLNMDYSINNGTDWANAFTYTGATTQFCAPANVVTLPANAAGVAQLKIRFTMTVSSNNRYVDVDYVSITGTVAGSGTWAANAQVSLVDPSSTVTVLKAYGAADGSPYNVQPYYTGPGTYVIRLAENNGGTATITGGSMNATNGGTCGTWTATCVVPPPPGEVAPGDTQGNGQTWTGTTTLGWPSASGATGYNVYRGLLADLPNLLNSSTDSCTKWTGAATSCTIGDNPAGVAGGFYWYLVTGTNGGGEGTAGNASTSACTTPPCVRVVNSTGTCP